MIVAPFIRSSALQAVLEAIPEDVEVSIVTRWRPLDLLAGASDLDVFDVAAARNIALYLRYDLHAKVFAADRNCLVGSANVTETALGWRDPANLELLTVASRDDFEIAAFEEELFRLAIRATPEHRDAMKRLVADLADVVQPLPDAEVATEDLAAGLMSGNWIPRSKNPEDLYAVYRGEPDAVGRAGLPGMEAELLHMGLPPALPEPHFNSWVRAAIGQNPLVAEVLRLIDENGAIDESEVGATLETLGSAYASEAPAEVLEVLRRWFNHFMADHFETKQDSIRLVRTRSI
ncbi:phospholipase D family protein [Candidatus Poriferisodalis sp.]|uniref:phospholipase D family protein n=1 Tax=Candidatus Poriferisodalis sp. TaxID=3101277 RepID=UPI003B025C91